MRRTTSDNDSGAMTTPMIDVVFLLLTFFLVGAPTGSDQIELPAVGTESRPVAEATHSFVVTVTADGAFSIDGGPADWETVRDRLIGFANAGGRHVLLHGDRDSGLGVTAQLIAECSRLELQLSLDVNGEADVHNEH